MNICKTLPWLNNGRTRFVTTRLVAGVARRHRRGTAGLSPRAKAKVGPHCCWRSVLVLVVVVAPTRQPTVSEESPMQAPDAHVLTAGQVLVSLRVDSQQFLRQAGSFAVASVFNRRYYRRRSLQTAPFVPSKNKGYHSDGAFRCWPKWRGSRREESGSSP